jgi:mRNA interferase YafQ
MYRIFTSTKFKKDLKLAKRRGYNLEKVKSIMEQLAAGEPLPAKNKDHSLIGNYVNRRECHIEPDWLLIYKLDKETREITFERTGSHADLFD